jgi:3',5'-cyclic AMP phosphodiesterase CpdA
MTDRVLKFIQISDLHIVEEGKLAYDVVDTTPYLDRAVEHINRMLPFIGPVEAVIATGDITDHGRPAQYERFRASVSKLEVPCYALPGNHDRRDTMRTGFAAEGYLPGGEGPLNYHRAFGGVHLVAVDTSTPGKPYGSIEDDTLDWLRDMLRDLRDEPVLLALHHPPFDTFIGHMDRQRLREEHRLLDLLASHMGPRLMICGHVHRFIAGQSSAGAYAIAPAVAHAVTLDHRPDGPSTFTMEPGGFLLHCFVERPDGGYFTSEYVPIGQFDGPYEFYPGRKS